MASNTTHRMSQAPRASMLPGSSTTSSSSAVKSRHLSHLHSQLAQLSANLSDLENLIKMTAIQAESMRGLGGWCGGMFMAASKVLGEETVANNATANTNGNQQRDRNTNEEDEADD